MGLGWSLSTRKKIFMHGSQSSEDFSTVLHAVEPLLSADTPRLQMFVHTLGVRVDMPVESHNPGLTLETLTMDLIQVLQSYELRIHALEQQLDSTQPDQ